MDAVFKALADPTRRSLLDELFREDGQTLSALAERFSMTRFGVMKHLKQLEEASLVVTKRRGRQKLHFLNPVPIRLVHDRWVSKYAEPWVAGLTGLKNELEEIPMEATKLVSWADGTAPVDDTAVFEIFIKTTPEKLWQAITDPKLRSRYNFGVSISSDWTAGSSYHSGIPGAVEIAEGENIEVDPPRLLVQSFNALWSDEVKAEGPTRVTWEIDPVNCTATISVVQPAIW